MKLEAIRDGFGIGLVDAGKINKNVIALTADLTSSTKCDEFAKQYPNRFYQCGICEQNMMSAAAGMAKLNKIPFVNSFAVFSPGRNWDQLRVSVCYSNMNVKIHGSHAGLSVGEDGATHQALEDIAITRVLPNIKVLVPCDANQARLAVIESIKHYGPVYIRTSRHKCPTISDNNFKIGKADILKKGKDITLIACGILVYETILAANILEKEGISAEVINCSTIKPLDKKTILNSAKKTKKVVTIEEHQIAGGMGSAIAEFLSSNYPVKISFIGVNDSFGESGTPEELFKKYGLDSKSIARKVRKLI